MFSRVPAQQIAKALDAFASLSLATVPVSNNGMVTPPRMTTPMPTDDNVEMASPSETPRTRLGGDEGSLEEKEEKAASPDTPVPAQGDAPQPPEPGIICEGAKLVVDVMSRERWFPLWIIFLAQRGAERSIGKPEVESHY